MTSADAVALLDWQIELGATEAICDAPVNRFELPKTMPKPAGEPGPSAAPPAPDGRAPAAAPPPETDPVADARRRAEAAETLEALAEGWEAFPHCALRNGASNFVFADGNPDARVMIIGEAPGRDEDLSGRPFVGRAGQLLDAMFAAIGMGRDTADAGQSLYITNVVPWRPPGNRTPEPAEIAMMLPFVERHVALAQPELLILMGNVACQALLGRSGITRLRGAWTDALGRPALPMFHPAFLMRQPHAKRDAWADLLSVQARLREL